MILQLKETEDLNIFSEDYPKNASDKATCHRTTPGLIDLCARSMISHTSVLKGRKKQFCVWRITVSFRNHVVCYRVYISTVHHREKVNIQQFLYSSFLYIFLCIWRVIAKNNIFAFIAIAACHPLANKFHYTTVYFYFRCITPSCLPNYTITMLNSLALFF